MENIFDINLNNNEITQIPTLSLAFLGDAVYEVMVRSWIVANNETSTKELHNDAVHYVSATAQAKAINKVLQFLTEEEVCIYKRGRNTKVNSIPAHTTTGEYHSATGFETLLGYLYVTNNKERLNQIFNYIMEA